MSRRHNRPLARKLTGIPEYELILARAGLFDAPLYRQEEMFVCPEV